MSDPSSNPSSALLRWPGAAQASVVLTVAVYLLLVAWQANKPLLLDNMDFPAVAAATAQSGVPVYYRGEDNPRHSGLYHPPLYIYLLALWFKVFGVGAVPVRAFGAVTTLLAGWLTSEKLAPALLSRTTAHRLRPWFWPAFLLNPYTLQTSGIADIDSTVYGPLLLLTLYAVLRIVWRDGEARQSAVAWWEWALVSLAVAATAWAKLTTIFLLVPVLPALLLARYSWRRALPLGLALFGFGALLFLGSYHLYGWLSGQSVTYSYRFLAASFWRRGVTTHASWPERAAIYRQNARAMVPFVVSWTGLLPWLAAPLALALLATRRAIERRRSLTAALVLLWALGGTLIYCAQTRSFGGAPFKYVYVFWPVVVYGMAALADAYGASAARRDEGPSTGRTAWRFLALAAVFGSGALTGAAWLGDDLLVRFPPALHRAIWLAPAAAFILGLLHRPRRATGVERPLHLALALHCGLGLGVAAHQAAVPYATQYNFGQVGFEETVNFLRRHTREGEAIACMKDVGFAAERPYFENFQFIYGSPAALERFLEIAEIRPVRYLVFSEGIGEDQLVVNPPLAEWISSHTTLVASFGHYRIYRLATATGASP